MQRFVEIYLYNTMLAGGQFIFYFLGINLHMNFRKNLQVKKDKKLKIGFFFFSPLNQLKKDPKAEKARPHMRAVLF